MKEISFIRNIVPQLTKGRYICFLDPADISLSNRLDSLKVYIDTHKKVKAIVSQGFFIDTNEAIIGYLNVPKRKQLKVQLLDKLVFHLSCLTIRRADLVALSKNTRWNRPPFDKEYYQFFIHVVLSLAPLIISDRLVKVRYKKKTVNPGEALRIKELRFIRNQLITELGIIPDNTSFRIYNYLMDTIAIPVEEIEIGMVFLNKILEKNAILKKYTQPLLFNFFKNKCLLSYNEYKKTNWSLEKNVVSYIKNILPANAAILEFGSGSGTDHLLKQYTVTSIEHDYYFYNQRGLNHKVFYAPIEKRLVQKIGR